MFIEERKGGLRCPKCEPETLKNLCADLREALRQLQKITHIHQAQLVQKSHSELTSGQPHCAEICVLRCESKSFLQGCRANSHSRRCAKSHILDRRSSCPAMAKLTSVDYVSSFLQHILRTRPSKQRQDQPYRHGNPADGDELPCAVEHSVERVS